VAGVAHQRIHGTTARQPAAMLAEERARLTPPRPTAIFVPLLEEERRVSRDGYVCYGGSRYGVPWRYSGRAVTVRADELTVEIRDGDRVVARHPRALLRGMTLSLPGQYQGVPLNGSGRPQPALAMQVAGPEVEVRSLRVYEAVLAGGEAW